MTKVSECLEELIELLNGDETTPEGLAFNRKSLISAIEFMREYVQLGEEYPDPYGDEFPDGCIALGWQIKRKGIISLAFHWKEKYATYAAHFPIFDEASYQGHWKLSTDEEPMKIIPAQFLAILNKFSRINQVEGNKDETDSIGH